MEEQWIVINEAPNYQVSELGRILSVEKKKVLKGTPNSEGYLCVTLRNNGKDVPRTIHRLVATYFINNPNNLPEVNHKNGLKIDNRVENLEWCTKAVNLRHALDTGLRQPYRDGKNNAKKKVVDNSTGKEYDSLKSAAFNLGINYNTLRTHMSKGKTTLCYI